MVFNVQSPWELIAASLICGVLLGAFYDVFRLLRAFGKGNGVFVALQDIAFCLVFSAVMCVLFYNYTNGRIRFYALFFAACGFAAYYFTAGKLTLRVFTRVSGAVVRLASSAGTAAKRLAFSARRRLFSVYERARQLGAAKKGFGL